MKLAEHREHIFTGEPDEDLIESLEPDQLVIEMDRPVPRRQLGRGVTAALWVLRVFLLAITAMVLYAFVAGVMGGSH